MKELITPQKARKSLTDFGWLMVNRELKCWPSRCGRYEILRGGNLYFRRRINPGW